MPALVECVPNFSEGKDQSVIEALRAAIVSVPGVQLLDVQTDASHNRSVFTFVAPPPLALDAAFGDADEEALSRAALGSRPLGDAKAERRAVGYLVRRGFSTAAAWAAVRAHAADDVP